MKSKFKNFIRFLKAQQEGVALIEFAIVLPVLLIVFTGSVEVVRAMLVMQKVEKTISLIDNITTQYLAPGSSQGNFSPISKTQLDTLTSWIPSLMGNYNNASKQTIILSDVTTDGTNTTKLNWQYCTNTKGTYGSLVRTSQVGTTIGATVTLPSGFSMQANEEVVIGEIYYQYTPMLPHVLAPLSSLVYYKTTVYVPRYESLKSFISTCP